MAWLEDLGKTIGQVAQGVSDAAQTVTVAAQETMEQIKQQREQEQQDSSKCPNCGQPLNGVTAVCPLCGYELRSSGSDGSIESFVKELNKLEKNRNAVIDSISQALSKREDNPTDERIASTIRNYVIPNTKEDIFEFMILAASNIDSKVIAKMTREKGVFELETTYRYKTKDEAGLVQSAWVSKFDQAYQKAKIAFGNDPDFAKIQQLYDSKMREIETEREKAKSIFSRMW